MRHLGIDYGTKRIGVACSDDEGKLAFPLRTVEANGREVGEICEMAKAERVGMIVVGLSSEMPGVDSSMRGKIQALADSLQKACGLPIEFENEMFTSRLAGLYSKKDSDAAAAALILQSFLDRKNRI